MATNGSSSGQPAAAAAMMAVVPADNQTQEPTAPNSQAGGPSDGGPDAAAAAAAAAAIQEPGPERLPARKETTLREFLGKMEDYAPIIPDAVTHYFMTRAGLPPPPQTDPRLARLLALATQKFIADIAADAYQYSRIRASNTNANNPMGNLGAAAGFPIPGQPGAGAPGGPAAGGGPQGGKAQGGGAAGAAAAGANAVLGIQRPGYGGGGAGGSANKTILSIEDLGMAIGEYGVNIKRSEFYR